MLKIILKNQEFFKKIPRFFFLKKKFKKFLGKNPSILLKKNSVKNSKNFIKIPEISRDYFEKPGIN